MAGAPAAFEREYYATYYRDYERQNPPRKMRHYRLAVERHMPAVEDPRVLDFGCAFGTFLACLDPRWHPYGMDVSEYAIGAARRCLPRARLEVVRDGKVPFAEVFHAITAWDVLEHIAQLDDAAQQVSQHLAEHGAFLFVVPVYDGPLGPLVQALDADTTHVHRVSRRFWLDWANRHFDVQEWWGVFRFLFPWGYYLHWPTRALRRIAPAIAVVARRKHDAQVARSR
jgi:SAM-dependent methyltransferase